MPELPKLPPIARQPLSVVLLVRDDSAHAEDLLAGWVAFLEGLGRAYEVLVVGAGPGGAARLEGEAGRHPRVRLLCPGGRGEGAALRAALAEARYPLLFYAALAPEYRPADLGRMLEKPHGAGKDEREIDHVHMMTGYRAGRPVPLPWRVLHFFWRVFCRVALGYWPQRLPGWLGWRNHLGRLVVRALFGVRYHDVGCPFRLFRRNVFARIPIQSDGAFAHVEVLAKANFLGHMMGEEVPLDARPRPAEGGWRALWAEGWRVFAHPDFGPAFVGEEKEELAMLSARNQLKGKVKSVKLGEVMAEVVVTVGDAEIVSVITRGSAEAMGLKAGDEVSAIIKSTEVMIAKG
jgi:molybdopterin-binding protein